MERRVIIRGFVVVAGLAIGLGLFVQLVAAQGLGTIVDEIMRFGVWPFLGFLAISLTIFAL